MIGKNGNCPTCGRAYPTSRPPKYPSEVARRAAIAASNRAKAARQAEADRRQLMGIAPEVFGSGDIGNALRSVGRHWGENAGVLQRGEKHGTMLQVEDKPQGHRTIRQWRFVEHIPDPLETT